VLQLRTQTEILQAKEKHAAKQKVEEQKKAGSKPPSQDQRMAVMRERVQQLEKHYNELIVKYKYESESYQTDIEKLKSRLKNTEENVMWVRHIYYIYVQSWSLNAEN